MPRKTTNAVVPDPALIGVDHGKGPRNRRYTAVTASQEEALFVRWNRFIC
jgi:hypothetical protein